MAHVEAYKGLPKIDGQHHDIFPGSPMAIVGVFTEVIRARFRADNAEGLPWIWHEDPTPLSNENNTPDTEPNGVPRTIYIESQYTEDNDARNFRPAILIEKEDTQALKLVLGNRAAVDMPSGLQVFWTHVICPISVLCLSNKRGESGNLGDVVFAFLQATRNEIREVFNLHDISPPTLGKTTIYRRSTNENETWSTPVSITTQFKFLWRTRPIAPLLQEIYMKFFNAGNGNFDKGAVEILSTSNRTR